MPVHPVNFVQGELTFDLFFYVFLLLLLRLTLCLVALALYLIFLGLGNLLLDMSGCVSKIPKLKC